MKKLKRKDRQIETGEAVDLLCRCEYGVLSTTGDDGWPYGVPLNYVYKDNCIYFHSARKGHKIENITACPRVSFCVVGQTKVLPLKFGTEYESVIIFGSASRVKGTERQNALLWLLEKYCPGNLNEGRAYIEKKMRQQRSLKSAFHTSVGKKHRHLND